VHDHISNAGFTENESKISVSTSLRGGVSCSVARFSCMDVSWFNALLADARNGWRMENALPHNIDCAETPLCFAYITMPTLLIILSYH
jgi:hypothetical protein